jgi:hypothetical protein
MGKSLEGINVPEDWIGQTVVVLSQTTGEDMLPEGGYPLVASIYSGELRVVNSLGVSLSLLTSSRAEEESYFYPGGDTFFPWNSVVRISLAAPL